MKKVFVTLLMLMMVVGLFATVANNKEKGSDSTPDHIKITATVPGDTAIYFAGDDSSTTVADSKTLDIGEDNKATADIYAVCETNSATPITLNLYGTALTLKNDTGYSSANKGKVDLKATVTSVGDTITDLTTPTVTFDDATTTDIATNGTTTGLDKISFGESSADAAGQRTLRAKISLEANMTDMTAGTYDSYLILEVDSNQ